MIDYDKLKHPNTGLYTYCLELYSALQKVEEEYDIEITYLTTKKASLLLASKNVRRITLFDKLLFRVPSSIDVYHSPFQLGKFFPKGINSVLTIHDLNFLYEGKVNVDRFISRVQKRVDKCDFIVAISEFAKSDICKHLNLGNKPIKVVYNGCSFYQGQEVAAPTNYKPTNPFLFSIGTVLRKKNFHVLPCLLENNDMELVIAGNPSDYSDAIMEEAIKYGVENRVHIIGSIDDADKDWYYRNCSAFVFPSLAEGFGLPVLEAMSYGRPIFLSKHTSLPEIGKDFAYYFDVDFTRSEMQKVLSQGLIEFADKDVSAQIEYAKSYTWENTAREYCKIYNQL